MKILLVSGPDISLKEPFNSGIEAFMVSLANQLADDGHEVHVVAKTAQAGAKFRLVNPFKTTALHKLGCLNRLIEKHQFKKLNADDYDVIHYNMYYPHLLEAGMHFNKSSFLTLHSPADRKRVSTYHTLLKQGNIRFVAISERIKRQWDNALNTNVPLILNGINMNLWPAKSTTDGNYLLWSARINKEKNPAAAICLAKQLNLPLKIAGRVTDQHYFDEEVKPHLNQQIEYVGHITQQALSSLAKKAWVYLATATWQEPFGLAALEMLASGVPVVGFNTAVPPDWEHESVLTTASHCWQDLVELVKKSHSVSTASCKAFASSMNIQGMTSAYTQLYQQVLSETDCPIEQIFTHKHVMQASAEQAQILN